MYKAPLSTRSSPLLTSLHFTSKVNNLRVLKFLISLMHCTGCEAVEMWCFGLGTTCQDSPVKGSGERRNQPRGSNAMNYFGANNYELLQGYPPRRYSQYLYIGAATAQAVQQLGYRRTPTDPIFCPHSIQTGSDVQPFSYSETNGGLFSRGYRDRGVNLTTHFYLVPKLRMNGAIPPIACRSS